MKIKEKLDMFSRVAMQQALDKYESMTQDIENEYARAVEAAGRQARKKAEILLQTEKYKAEQEMHKRTLAAATEQKKELTAVRNRLLDELFAEVKARLESFVNSPEYKDYLMERIQADVKDRTNFEIRLRPADINYADEIKKLTGSNITEDRGEDFLGGFKLVLTDKRAVIDSTFASRLARERRSFAGFTKS